MAATEKDKQIIRQSQLKLCLDYFQMCGICPTMSDTIRITKMLEEYVIQGYNDRMQHAFEKIDQYIQSQYKP
jgi:hypothetical protein